MIFAPFPESSPEHMENVISHQTLNVTLASLEYATLANSKLLMFPDFRVEYSEC